MENNYLSNWQKAKLKEELEQCQDSLCRLKTKLSWAITDVSQDASLAGGIIAGIPESLYETVDGIISTASNPSEALDALKIIVMQDNAFSAITESLKQDYIARIEHLQQEYERAGMDGAFNAGREVGKLAIEVVSIVAGGAGIAKSGVNLTRKAVASTKEVIARGGSIVSPSNGMLSKHYTSLGNGMFEGPNGGKIINTGVVDKVTGNAVFQRVNSDGTLGNQFFMIDSQGRQLSVNRPDLLKNDKSNELRPSYRQSEIDIGNQLGDGIREQVSFLHGKEVSYGTAGSVRPDFCIGTVCSIEVKNYSISNKAALIDNVTQQAIDRSHHLPKGMKQMVIIDVRGQQYSIEDLNNIRKGIENNSNGIISKENIDFKIR